MILYITITAYRTNQINTWQNMYRCVISILIKKSRDISKIVDFIKMEILLRLHLTGNEMDGRNEWSL